MRGRVTYDFRPCDREECPDDIPKKRKGAVKDMPWSQYKEKRFCGPECVRLHRISLAGWSSKPIRKNSPRLRPIVLKPIDYFIMGRPIEI